MINEITEVGFQDGATLSSATVTLADMGERTIAADIKVEGNDLSVDGMELQFRGERFVPVVKDPNATKTNERVQSVVSVTFLSYAISQLKRFWFFKKPEQGPNVFVDQYVVPIGLTFTDFVDYLGAELSYYFGTEITCSYDPNLDLTELTEAKYLDINYTTLWDVLTLAYEAYGVKWRIVRTNDTYNIFFTSASTEIAHVFKYGYDGGLTHIERQVQSEDLHNKIFGRGTDRNLPFYYFKRVREGDTTGYVSDPDCLYELKYVNFEEMRGIAFRWYVRGWMQNTHHDTTWENNLDPDYTTAYNYPIYTTSDIPSSPQWLHDLCLEAFNKGKDSTNEVQFNPIEYVKDDVSIERYGELWGCAETDESIYPTMQGVTVSGLGRIDEVVDYEDPTGVDDIDVAASEESKLIQFADERTYYKGLSNRDWPVAFAPEVLPPPDPDNPSYYINTPSPEWVGYQTHHEAGTVHDSWVKVTMELDPEKMQINSWDPVVIPAGLSGYVQFDKTAESVLEFTKLETTILGDGRFQNEYKDVSAEWIAQSYSLELVGEPYFYAKDVNGNYITDQEGKVKNPTLPAGSWILEFHVGAKMITRKGYDGYTPSRWPEIPACSIKIHNINIQTYRASATPYRTFYVWVKNIWQTEKSQSETAAEYAARVWGPILGNKGQEAKVVFSSGPLSASSDWDFVISKVEYDTSKTINGVQSEWKLLLLKSEAEYQADGKFIPRAGIAPSAGNYFFFVDNGIVMPQPFVIAAEARLDEYKMKVLSEQKDILPSWTVNFDKIRIVTLATGEQTSLYSQLEAGKQMKIQDTRLTDDDILTKYIESLTISWNEGESALPNVEVTLADVLRVYHSPIQTLASQIRTVQMESVTEPEAEDVSRRVAARESIPSTGANKAKGSAPLQLASTLQSPNFASGMLDGTGWSIYRNNDGDYTLEVDVLKARRGIVATNVTVDEWQHEGGVRIMSAANMRINRVDVSTDYYTCYFDNQNGSLFNLFRVNDIALCNKSEVGDGSTKYYRYVIAEVSSSYVRLSRASGNHDGDGIPSVGDEIIQYGNTADANRQHVIVVDAKSGHERMLFDLNSVSATGVVYYYVGAAEDSNGVERRRWYVGDTNGYIEYTWNPNANGGQGGYVLSIGGDVYIGSGQVSIESLNYLAAALGDDQSQGLVLSNQIAVYNGNDIMGGLSGVYDSSLTGGGIAAWFGGTKNEYVAGGTGAKVLFRFDGSGYVAAKHITWDAAGNCTIDGTVQLGIGNETVATLVEAVQGALQKSAVTSKGSATLPVYFDSNAVAQTVTGIDVPYDVVAGRGVAARGMATLQRGGGGGMGTVTGIKFAGDPSTIYEPSQGLITLPDYPTAASLISDGLASQSYVQSYFSDNFTQANIKSTLGIYDWALAASKPSYNFSEIGSKPTTLAGYGITDAHITSGVITLGGNTITPATLTNGKIPLSQIPDAILGQLIYGGTVNGSGVVTLSQNAKDKWGITSLTLTSTNYSTYEGAFFIASADATSGVPSTLGLLVGDWVVATASGWGKIDNTDAVTGVKGDAESSYRIGNVNITKGNIGLGNVENTALSTWAGTSNITTLGTIATGVWHGTAIADDYIASAAAWNAKYDKPSGGIPKTDLASGVQTSLGLADTALQSHQTIYNLIIKKNGTQVGSTYNPATAAQTIDLTDVASANALSTVQGYFTNGVANNAARLSNTSKIGDTNQPVYFTANGVPAAISYTIGRNVAANEDVTAYTGSTYINVASHVISAKEASGSQGGVVTTSAQTFAGDKTFNDNIQSMKGVAARGMATLQRSGGGGSGTLTQIQINGTPLTDVSGVVNIPLASSSVNGAMSSADKSKLDNIEAYANNYVLPAATSGALGGISLGYSASGKNYPVQLDGNNKAYVNVPWENTTYESKAASQGGTAVSLVTTGEKYTWNNKYSKPSGGIPASDLAESYYLASNPNGYISGNQTITLSGDVSGSGATSIAVTIGTGKVTNAMLAGSIAISKISGLQTALDNKLATSLKGAANGLAELDANGLVPSSQLPSYVDDVLEYASKSAFPSTGTSGKIYVALDTNLTWRWSGSAYVEISPSLALGETSSTAYRGDRGATAYAHATDANRLTTAKSSGFYKFATTAEGHIASVTAVTASDLTSLIGSTTYAPYNSAGYLPLSGGTMVNTNLVTNLNADLLDGKHSSDFVSALGTSGDYLTWTKTGGSANNIIVPYASLATDTRVENLANQTITYRQTAGGGLTYKPTSAVVKRILGNSVVWNNVVDGLFSNLNYFSKENATATASNGVATITTSATSGRMYVEPAYIKGHTYYISICGKYTGTGTGYSSVQINESGSYPTVWSANFTTSMARYSGIFTPSSNMTGNVTNVFRCTNGASGGVAVVSDYFIVDLTLFFNGNIPTGLTAETFERDYGYLLANPEYNAGTIINNSAEGLETVGFNLWDEEWDLGNGSNGDIDYTTRIHLVSKNYIPVLPDTTYYFKGDTLTYIYGYDRNKVKLSTSSFFSNYNTTFTTPSGCYYIKFQRGGNDLTYSNNICINLSDSNRNGQYEHYKKNVLPLNLNSFRVKDAQGNIVTINGLKKAGSVYDEIVGKKFIQRVETRAYQSGDESDISVITDGTNTNYPLATPIEYEIIDEAPYEYPIDVLGTEGIVSDEMVAPFVADIQYGAEQRDIAVDINNLHISAGLISDRTSVLEGYFTDGIANNAARLSNTSAIGSTTKPVYFTANGVPAECSTYGGGTAVTLNGTSKAANTASFYAPTGAGTAGQILKSTAGTPEWINQSALVAGKATQLETSRTLWGQSFNGTSDIGTDKFAKMPYLLFRTVTSGSDATIGYVGRDANNNVIHLTSYSGVPVSIGSGQQDDLYITTGHNVGIGTTSPSEKLHVAGNILANGNIVANGGVAARGMATLQGGTGTGNPVTQVNIGNTPYTPTNGIVSLPAYPTWATLSGKPTNVSAFTNDSGYISGDALAVTFSSTTLTSSSTSLYLNNTVQRDTLQKVTISSASYGGQTFSIKLTGSGSYYGYHRQVLVINNSGKNINLSLTDANYIYIGTYEWLTSGGWQHNDSNPIPFDNDMNSVFLLDIIQASSSEYPVVKVTRMGTYTD